MFAKPSVALFKSVFQAQIDWIDTEFLREFVQLRFASKSCLGVADPSEGTGPQLVGIDETALGPAMGEANLTCGIA